MNPLGSRIFFVVATIFNEAALLAERVLRSADSATVTNHIHVDFVEAMIWNHRGHQGVRFLIGAFFGDQSEPPSYAKYVRVYWKDRAIARKQQSACNGLRAYAFKACEEPRSVLKRRSC